MHCVSAQHLRFCSWSLGAGGSTLATRVKVEATYHESVEDIQKLMETTSHFARDRVAATPFLTALREPLARAVSMFTYLHWDQEPIIKKRHFSAFLPPNRIGFKQYLKVQATRMVRPHSLPVKGSVYQLGCYRLRLSR